MSAAAQAMLSDFAEDARFMSSALALGRRGLGNVWPNPAVGAIIVRHGPSGPLVVGRGWTQPGGRPHAETEALAHAGTLARGATLYVTLEPCSHHGKSPPCADAIVAAGISTVVSALEDPNPEVAGRGHARLEAAGVAVRTGTGAAEAAQAHAGHIRRMREQRPEVTLKLAISADGKAGLAGRRPAAISGERARARVHLLRAMNDAISPMILCSPAGCPEWPPARRCASCSTLPCGYLSVAAWLRAPRKRRCGYLRLLPHLPAGKMRCAPAEPK